MDLRSETIVYIKDGVPTPYNGSNDLPKMCKLYRKF